MRPQTDRTLDFALMSLRPGAAWVRRGDVLEWLDETQTQPTQAEIEAEIARLQARVAIPQSLSRSQFFRVLARSGIITAAEAAQSARTGEMPANIAAITAGLPAQDRLDAEILWATAVTFERSNPLFAAAATAGLATEVQIDGLFALGATLL